MSPKRGDRVAPPPIDDEYELVFANTEAVRGWTALERQARANLRKAWEALTKNPRSRENLNRQHQLKGDLGQGIWKGTVCERWQYEVTGGGRLWYLIEDDTRTVLLEFAGTGHPKATD